MSAADRTAVVKLLKARGAKARRGHLRIPVGELFWYVDVLADGAGPTAPLRLEVGCWTAALPPEPDGGAVDCPLGQGKSVYDCLSCAYQQAIVREPTPAIVCQPPAR